MCRIIISLSFNWKSFGNPLYISDETDNPVLNGSIIVLLRYVLTTPTVFYSIAPLFNGPRISHYLPQFSVTLQLIS